MNWNRKWFFELMGAKISRMILSDLNSEIPALKEFSYAQKSMIKRLYHTYEMPVKIDSALFYHLEIFLSL